MCDKFLRANQNEKVGQIGQKNSKQALSLLFPFKRTRLLKMSSNQKKIRDIERQMKKFGPDNAELKKRLEDLKAVKEGVKVQEKLRKNSVKYHMVKFIERKKVTRAIRSIDSKLDKNDPDSDNLKAKKLQLEEDLAYIM